jgi:hypothetical protein
MEYTKRCLDGPTAARPGVKVRSHKLSDSDFAATMLHLRTATAAAGGAAV